jgi:MFS family permease
MSEMANKKWLNRNVVAMGVTSLFSDTSHEMATSALPTFLTVLVGPTLAPQLLGIISGLSDGLASFMKTFSGWFSDKIGKRKPLTVLGYVLTGFFVGLIGFATNWIEVLFCRVLAWIGRGMREPPRDAMLADSVDKKFYGHAFGFNRALDTIGAVIGPLLAFFLITILDIRKIFFLSFIPGALAVVAIAFGVKEQKSRIKKKVKGLFFHLKTLPPNFKLFVFIMFIFGIGNFNRTLLLLRVQEVLTPANGMLIAGSIAVFLYAIRNVAQAIADYIVGSISDKIGKRILLAFVGFFLFGIVSLGFIYTTTNFYYFMILFILSGVSAASYTALEKAYAADLLPSHIRGTGYGVLNTIDGIGDLISSFFVGTIWTLLSPSLAFVYGAIISFIAALLLIIKKV